VCNRNPPEEGDFFGEFCFSIFFGLFYFYNRKEEKKNVAPSRMSFNSSDAAPTLLA
jgi:hypothetical protein